MDGGAMKMELDFNQVKKNYENLNLTKQDFAEFASSVYLDSPQKSTVVLSDEEKKEKFIYYRSLLEEYKKTIPTLQMQRENLNCQLKEHNRYGKQLKQDYESMFPKYKESFDKTLDTLFPHFVRPFRRWAKKLFHRHPKAGPAIYFGSLAIIIAIPVLRSLGSFVFFAGMFSEVFYAMKGKFFLKEYAENKRQADQLNKRLNQILAETEQLQKVNSLASKNVMLNKMVLNLAKSNVKTCQNLIHKLLESEDDKTKEKSEQVTDTSTRDDTKEVSHESSHPKVLQKSISKPKQSDKEST